jgi:hypothetical protein
MPESDFLSIEILQNYCLGLLNAEEEKKVIAICHKFPEIANELQLLRAVIENYKSLHTIQHDSELRKTIWEALKNIRKENL